MSTIYRVDVSDGTTQYFDNTVEADFYFNDTAACGFTVRKQEFNMPATARDFARFMNDHETECRKIKLAVREYADSF